MRYKLLGKSGLCVSELCLGALTFGTEWGIGSDKKESKRVFDLFEAEGGNFIDTANFYNDGTSEKYVGEFLQHSREKWLLDQDESIIPIVGARTEAQLKENLGCLGWKLPPESLSQLNDVSKIPHNFPFDFFENQEFQEHCLGNTLKMIDYSH